MQSEKKTEPYLVAQVKKRKGYCIKLLTKLLYWGLPDRLVLPMGYIVFRETKVPRIHPVKYNFLFTILYGELGFTVYVADTKEKVNIILEEYDKWYGAFR